MNQTVCRSVLALLFSMTLQTISAQQVTLSNNLLYDVWLTPNLRVGVRASEHWSLGLDLSIIFKTIVVLFKHEGAV